MRGKTRVREFRISPTPPLHSHIPTNDNVVIIIFENAFGGKNKGISKRERVFLDCVYVTKKMLLRKLRICLRDLFLYAEYCVRSDAAAAAPNIGFGRRTCVGTWNMEELQLRIFIFFVQFVGNLGACPQRTVGDVKFSGRLKKY